MSVKGELHKVAHDLAREVERRADDFQRLKERALESLLRMKRAGELDRLAQELDARACTTTGEPVAQEVGQRCVRVASEVR